MACYYKQPNCNKETWECDTCGTEYCTETHYHQTDLGRNVECVVCERERLRPENGQSKDA